MPDVTQQQEIDLLNLASGQSANANVPKNLPSEPSFDLLGGFETAEAKGNNTMPDLLSDSQAKPASGLDDLFGSFARPTTISNSNLPDLNNINFNAFSTAPSNSNATFDPFGNESFGNAATLLQPTSKETSPSQARQPPTAPAANKDPFADIGNLASGLNASWNTQNPTASKTTPVMSPQHQFGGFTASPQGPSTPVTGQARTPSDPPKADYSRSHFSEPKAKQNGTQNATSAAAAAGNGGGGDIFADILGAQGYNFAKSPAGPRSINEMRKEELVKDMDPDKLRIMEWVRTMLYITFIC